MNIARGRGFWVLLWLLAILPGTLNAAAGPWKFVVFGDSIDFGGSEVNTNILGELASAVVKEQASFLLFAGDFTAWGSPTGFRLWTNTVGALHHAGIPVYPTVGNHDLGDLGAFTEMVAAHVPRNGPVEEIQTTYALGWSNALFLVLNVFAPTNTYRVNQPWVDMVLSTNTRPHVFAVSHVPAFRILHYDCLDNYVTNRDRFWDSLSNAQCRVYFSGHDHFYDHCQLEDGDGEPQNDLHQFVVGTGGAPLYADGSYGGNNSLWKPRRLKHEPQYGYVVVEVDGEDVTITWNSRAGAGIYVPADVFTYSVRRSPPLLRHHYAPGQLTLAWSGGAVLQASPNPVGVFRDVRAAKSPYVVTNFGGSRMFYRLAEQPVQAVPGK